MLLIFMVLDAVNSACVLEYGSCADVIGHDMCVKAQEKVNALVDFINLNATEVDPPTYLLLACANSTICYRQSSRTSSNVICRSGDLANKCLQAQTYYNNLLFKVSKDKIDKNSAALSNNIECETADDDAIADNGAASLMFDYLSLILLVMMATI